MADKKLTKRKIQAINTKNKIYEKAVELIKKEGFDNISISQICKEADVSVGAFYHHFKTKENIIIENYKKDDEGYEQLIDKLKVFNSLDKIVEISSYWGKWSEEYEIDLVSHVYKSLINIENEYFISEERPMFIVLKNIIIEGQEKKEICSDIEPEDITRSIVIFGRGIIYDWCLHKGDYDLEKEIRTRMRMFVKSFQV
ncbi:TetR/AcrR family transcriptional regulator [Oceanirhabdus seepicola]|uniref:TetR/AcrR family transcriptional regulator n=1 Tax=Oceanirhabdus seepicola TaxID=2828781 RepID=A0A9J6NW75_9CLOT|nr:TetR/AcrR family transcriptional regulator [Oceanirhabdus seepicola]MCM1988491.1 TetR/AcrR family transcriptional regulator [Oceanirhabdus seepicola]